MQTKAARKIERKSLFTGGSPRGEVKRESVTPTAEDAKDEEDSVVGQFGNFNFVIPSITTTAVSRANEGVDALGFGEAPFRSQ
jgi:hypothetical protein